jgi:hypothetical protein
VTGTVLPADPTVAPRWVAQSVEEVVAEVAVLTTIAQQWAALRAVVSARYGPSVASHLPQVLPGASYWLFAFCGCLCPGKSGVARVVARVVARTLARTKFLHINVWQGGKDFLPPFRGERSNSSFTLP